MKKHGLLPGLLIISLLLLTGLLGCGIPDDPLNSPPADALTQDQLLANLDALEGHASKGLTLPGKTMFTLPGGAQLGTRDLSAYLDVIRTDLAASVSAAAGGSPYLVVPVRLSWLASGNGQRNSGLMWVPFTWGKRLWAPIISYQHGTQVYRECAPSRFNANPLAVFSSADTTGALQNYVECVVGALMASAGYIVVMPDYPGFGDSTETHPYVNANLGLSVKDIIGAAGLALTGRVKPNGRIFLTGYSEGGYATMAGARALYSSGTVPTGIVPCDGAYDLSGVMLDQMLNHEVKVPSYLLYTASGYSSVYDDIDLDLLLESDFAAIIRDGYFSGTHTNAQIDALGLPSQPSLMLMDGAITELSNHQGVVFAHLADNNAWMGLLPYAPILLVHCPTDDVVPYQNALSAKQALTGMYFQEGLVRIQDVQPVPFVDTLMGSVHVAAFPTAMLAAFSAIDGANH